MTLADMLPHEFASDVLDRKAVTDAQIQAGYRMDPGTIVSLAGMSRDYPWMEPSATLAFAQAGYDSYSPEVLGAARLSLGKRLREDKVAKRIAQKRKFDQVAANLVHDGNGFLGTGIDLGYTVSQGLKGDIPGAFAGPSGSVLPKDSPGTGLPLPGGATGADVAKTVTRTAGLAAQTPLQEAQGFIRSGAQGINELAQGHIARGLGLEGPPPDVVGQTQAGQAVREGGWKGALTDVGSGYLPDLNSPSALRAAEVARQAAPTINGHAFTVGRVTAFGVNELIPGVAEPDSFAFNAISGIADATVAWRGDPSNAVLAGLSEARKAGRVFSPEPELANALAAGTGLVASTARPTVNTKTVAAFLDSPAQKETQASWAEKTAVEIWRDSNKKLPVTTAQGAPFLKTLGEATTPEAVRETLGAAVPTFQPSMMPGGFAYSVHKLVPDSKMFSTQTARFLQQPGDKNTFLPELDKYLTEGRVPRVASDKILNDYINAESKDEIANALVAAGKSVEQVALAHHANPKVAKQAGLILGREESESRVYSIDQITGGERDRPGVVIDAAHNPIPSPELLSERLNSGIYFPDPRAVRRATSNAAAVFTSKPWSHLIAAPEVFLENWRPLHIGRPSLTLRVLADSQLDVAANGYESLFSHPFHTISAMVGSAFDKPLAQKLNRRGVEGSFLFGPEGEPIIPHLEAGSSLDVHQAAQDNIIINRLQHAFSGVEEPGKVALNDFIKVSRDNPNAAEAMLSELNRMKNDPIVRGLLQQTDPTAAKEWFHYGAGSELRDQFAPIAKNIDEVNALTVSQHPGYTMNAYGDITEQDSAERLVDSLLDSVSQRTGGHTALVDAIRTGEIDGIPLWKNNQPNPRALPSVQAIFDTGGGPQWVKMRRTVTLGESAKSKATALLSKMTTKYMHALLTVPDAYLNQNPAYAQSLWKNTEKYVPWLDAVAAKEGGVSDYERFFQAAEDAKVPAEQIKRLRQIPLDGTSTDRLTAKELNYLAKGDAVHEMERLTHNIGSRSNFFDTWRFLFPFGDAFRLIATRWAKTIAENPNVLRRGQQVIQAGQQPGSGALNRALGDTMPAQSGFFHTDPQTGEEVFTYPGSQWMNDKLLGVPIPLNGAVKGLSLVGDGYPGIGPGATMPAQWFLPDTPAFDGVRKVLFPFGQPESEGPAVDIAKSLEPAWFSKIVEGPPDQKAYNNTVGYMMNYLASTGRFDLDGKDAAKDTARMMHEAKEDARWFYVVRGAAQSVSPSAPSPTWLIHDKTGHLAILQVVKDEYRAIEQAKGPDAALEHLVKSMGEKNVFVAQSFSSAIAFGLPVTSEGQAWARAHPDARQKYPTTYGLFAPQKGKFDITAFENQFTTGERRSLSPEEMIAQAENRVGQWKYFKMRDQIIKDNGGSPLNDEQQQWINGYRDALAKDLPGFDTFVAQPYDSTKRRTSAVRELQAAASDPELAKTDAGQGLLAYLGFRSQAAAQAQADGYRSPFQAKALRQLRDWLRGAGIAVVKDHPDFLPQWEQVWSREMTANDAVGD